MVTKYTEPKQIKPVTFSEKKKQGKQTEGNGQESSQQRTSSPGKDTRKRKHKQKQKQKKQTKANHIIIGIEQKNVLVSRLRKKGSPISSGIQLRQKDKGKDNGRDTQRKKNPEGKGDDIQMK